MHHGKLPNGATWNIRELGWRRRLTASFHCIAEIIGQFGLASAVGFPMTTKPARWTRPIGPLPSISCVPAACLILACVRSAPPVSPSTAPA